MNITEWESGLKQGKIEGELKFRYKITNGGLHQITMSKPISKFYEAQYLKYMSLNVNT